MPNRNEIILQNLQAARDFYVNYTDQLENFRTAPIPVNYLYLILSEINYAFYQSYLYAARNYPSTISACSQLDPNEQRSAWRMCVEKILNDDYGVHVDSYSFIFDDPQRDSRLQYNTQLTYIFNAIENIGSSLKSMLIEALEQCQQLAQNNNIPFTINIDDFRGWTPAQTFNRIFGKQGLIDIRFDSSRPYSSTSTQPEVDHPRILLANSAFTGSNPNVPVYGEGTVREIISHEFGHMFINFLGTSSTAWQMSTNPPDANLEPIPLTITVGGGGSGEPLLSEAYIQATNGYYSGINIDFGEWFRVGGYNITDRGVCSLTNLNFGINNNCSGGCENVSQFLVDREKNCIQNSNNGNKCIPFIPNSSNGCIPDDELGRQNAVFARLPGTYLPNFANTTDLNLFLNEIGNTTQNSAPKEGLADVFKIAITNDISTALPENEPRRIFFQQNIGKWLFTLLSDYIPENAVEFCL